MGHVRGEEGDFCAPLRGPTFSVSVHFRTLSSITLQVLISREIVSGWLRRLNSRDSTFRVLATGVGCRSVRSKSVWRFGWLGRIDFLRAQSLCDMTATSKANSRFSACQPEGAGAGPAASSGWRMPARCRRYKNRRFTRQAPLLRAGRPPDSSEAGVYLL